MASIERQIKKLVEDADDKDDLAEELQAFIEDLDSADLADFCELLATKLLSPADDTDEEEEAA